MAVKLRKLNQEGIDRFEDYVLSGAEGEPPMALLNDPTTSQPIQGQNIEMGSGLFDNRFDFGIHLNSLLRKHEPATFSRDQGFWSAMALVWFDRLCPQVNGKRKPDKPYRYILSSDYRHYYRHLVRTPWQLVHDHGGNARFLLTSDSAKARQTPLAVHGEILEQLGGRQQVLSNEVIIQHASRMYLDPEKNLPKRGVAGSGRGSARRFGFVLRQFDLTYDPASMTDEEFLAMLPAEFDRWKVMA
tara:strand:+ start:210255 stop:210986 length:732 start_codon:yes stop_codon:yes gene_type:complete